MTIPTRIKRLANLVQTNQLNVSVRLCSDQSNFLIVAVTMDTSISFVWVLLNTILVSTSAADEGCVRPKILATHNSLHLRKQEDEIIIITSV